VTGELVQIQIDDPPRTMFSSQNGRHLAWVSSTVGTSALRVSESDDPAAFETIAESEVPISSVGWAPDGSFLAYFTAPRRGDGAPSKGVERLHVINRDGSNSRVVASFETGGVFEYRTISGINLASNSVLWTRQTREGAGGSRGLASTGIDSGETESIGGDTGLVYENGLALSPDAKRLYFVRDAGTLIERDLTSKRERVLYRVDTKHECAIESVLVEPTGEHLLFFANPNPHVSGVCQNDPAAPQARTFRMRLADLERAVLRSESGADALTPELQSPDGRFVWFGNYNVPRTTEILDVSTTTFIPYSDTTDAWASRWPLAWIRDS
jgi:hypothetical protein